MRTTLVMAAVALALVVGAGVTRAAPGPMAWTDVGLRSEGTGTFTAREPLCPSGTFRDIGGLLGIKVRHTCADGSGTFDVQGDPSGTWSFAAGGTGRYATLRGSGRCELTFDDNDTFVRACEAVADFDNTPPTAGIERLSISRPGRAYSVQMTFNTADNVTGNAVSYRVSVLAAGRRIGTKAGTTAGGATTIALKVRPRKGSRRLTVVLRVADPLGNARTVSRSLRLRH